VCVIAAFLDTRRATAATGELPDGWAEQSEVGSPRTGCALKLAATGVAIGRSPKIWATPDVGVLGCDDVRLFGWQQQPEHQSDQQESGHITQQMTHLVRIKDRLACHDKGMHDARPDGEPDEAAMLGRIASRVYQKCT